MTYQLKISDPRVKARVQQAITFISQYVSSTAKPVAQSVLIKVFGQQQNPLGKYLRDKLLIVADPHYNHLTGKCKTYTRNREGFAELSKLINFNEDELTPEQIQELVTGKFTYTKKADRYYNPMQYIRTEVRRPLMASYGYKYDYDIMGAAPTLLVQYVKMTGLETELPAIHEYINNRKEIRERIATELDVSETIVKLVLTAMLHGAVIGAHTRRKIYQMLDYDNAKIEWLKQDVFIQEYKENIRILWAHIKKVDNIERLSEKTKSAKYRELEKHVMKQVYKFLKKHKINVFKEHDGWRCDKMVDQEALQTYIRQQTGYVVQFDYKEYV